MSYCIAGFLFNMAQHYKEMKDKIGSNVRIGDIVAILHKKRANTTPTLQVGCVCAIKNRVCEVKVEGLKTTRHRSTSIILINGQSDNKRTPRNRG